MSDFRLTWTPGAGVDAQNARYRVKGETAWIDNINVTDPNPQTGVETTADITDLLSNTVYQFQIESLDAGKTNSYGDIVEKIEYSCETLGLSPGTGSVRIKMPTPVPTVDTVYFRVHRAATEEIVKTGSCTGAEGTAVLTGIAVGTYYITWYMETVINGVTYTSVDQTGDYCETSNFTISVAP